MKHLLVIFIILIPIISFGQKPTPLSKLLWDRVKVCYSLIEEGFDGEAIELDKIDDSRNGYLKISGSWPACGCSCSSTVGAYKNRQNQYTILQLDEVLCDWEKKISSNKKLEDILPIDFGIKDFISAPITEKPDYPIFFVNFNIPRIGTDTKLKLELIPLGIIPEGNDLLCYHYIGINKHKLFYIITQLVKSFKDDKTLNFLLAGKFSSICENDQKLISEIVENNHGSELKSKKDVQNWLIDLKKIYNIYKMLTFDEIILGWDKQKSRFFIKEKIRKTENITFKKFLISKEYWYPSC